MRINSINTSYDLAFKSTRTDKQEVGKLRTGETPILENQKQNILVALNNLAETSDRKSIEFLLDVATNLQYGQNGNSEFNEIISESTEIQGERENTNWLELLSKTIDKALNASEENVEDLRTNLNSLISTKQPLTQDQKEILELRKEIKTAVSQQEKVSDTEELIRTADISRNLDFFISSSEISVSQKKRSLELMKELLSDDYKITPQLEDKKVQVLDELLKDLVVRTPQDETLTTKGINQLYTGMCGAISVCRKKIAHEDKVRYVELIMEELKDSPTMTVFDVTKLGTGEKVNIPKIKIDYNDAIAQGYRILDASAHNWMHNAHTAGDGSIQSETYTAFDRESYGLFNDTSWYEGMNPTFSQEKELLKRLIKEKELLESVQNTRKKQKDASTQIQGAKRKAVESQSKINGELNKIFATIFPDLTPAERTNLQKSLIKFYTGTQDNNEINVPEKLSDEIRQKIITDYLLKQIDNPETKKEAIEKSAKDILSLIDGYTQEDANIKKLSGFDTPKAKYTYYRKLFNLAAAHRLAIEADVNLKDGVVRFERVVNLPTRDMQVINHLQSLKGQDATTSPVINANSELRNKTKTEIEQELIEDIIRIESVLPTKIDKVFEQLMGKNIKQLTIEIYEDTAKKIKDGDKENLERASFVFGIKHDKTEVLKFIDKQINKLNGNISDKDLQEAIRLLGFENRPQMAQMFLSAFITSLQNGISEEEYLTLAERFGGKDKVGEGINNERENFINIAKEYSEIIEKWQVPSSRELIIQKMEKSGSILSRKKLDSIQRHFEQIRTESKKNDSIKNTKARNKANEDLYTFTSDQIEMFNMIEKKIPEIKKYCKMEYNAINKLLFDELEKQYSNLGMLNGQFWVREEGSTGLAANEQLRITEQMTGKPYHIEFDIEKAAKEIKKGNGSGVVSYSVDDSSYAFHAMYSPSVTSETFLNPITGTTEIRDIFWTDNSWGDIEKEYFWNGQNGFEYTDYGQGMGWKNGFIISKEGKIGLPVSEMKNALGANSKDGEKFGLVLDTILPGMPVNGYQKLYKMFNYILSMQQDKEFLAALESQIKDGAKIDMNFLTGLDDFAEKRTETLLKKAEKIKSKEEFDNLPDDDQLKLVMTMLSLHLSTNNPQLADSAMEATSLADIEELKKDFMESHTDEIAAMIAKSDECLENLMLVAADDLLTLFGEMDTKFGIKLSQMDTAVIVESIFYDEKELQKLDGSLTNLEKYLEERIEKTAHEKFKNEEAAKYFIENAQGIISATIDKSLKIKSLDSPVLTSAPLGEEFIKAVDKHLNPNSDEELLAYLQGLQYGTYDLADKFIEMLEPEDVGINIKHPFEYIEKLRAEDSNVYKAFAEVVGTHVIYTELAQKRPEDNSEAATPEDLYRSLHVKLAEMDVQKFIKKFKAEAFAKYKVRQAFPQPTVLPDEEIYKTTEAMFGALEAIDKSIKDTNVLIEIFDKFETIMQNTEELQLCYDIKGRRNLDLSNPAVKRDADKLRSLLIDFNEIIQHDESIKMISEPVQNLINELSPSDGIINGKRAEKSLNKIQKIYANWEQAGLSKSKFIQQREEGLKDMRENLQLMVFANIEPAYRNKAHNKLNNLITLIRKDAPIDKIDEAKDDYLELAIEKHIVKNPTVLLKECVNLLQEGKMETDEYAILKNYLLEALKVAQQTKIQYKLVQNAHEGISSKTRELLPLFSVQMTDGSKESMDSEAGMLYIIEQLKNSSEDYTTMKLFLEQSGLSQYALQALLNNFKMEEVIKVVDENHSAIKNEMNDLNKLNSAISEFLDKGSFKYLSFDQVLEQMKSFIKRRVSKDNIALQDYLEYLSRVQTTEEVKNLSSTMINQIVRSINEDAVAESTKKINMKIDFISDISKLLGDRCELINVINVPETSDIHKQRQEFFNKYDATQEHIRKTLESITNTIENYQFLNAEYRNQN